MKPDLQHLVLVCVGMICCTAVILLGHGNFLLQLLAAAGGLSGVGLLFKRSVMREPDAKP